MYNELTTKHYKGKVILYDKLIIQQKQSDWQTFSIFFHLF